MSTEKVETKTVDTKKEEETKPSSEMTGTFSITFSNSKNSPNVQSSSLHTISSNSQFLTINTYKTESEETAAGVVTSNWTKIAESFDVRIFFIGFRTPLFNIIHT